MGYSWQPTKHISSTFSFPAQNSKFDVFNVFIASTILYELWNSLLESHQRNLFWNFWQMWVWILTSSYSQLDSRHLPFVTVISGHKIPKMRCNWGTCEWHVRPCSKVYRSRAYKVLTRTWGNSRDAGPWWHRCWWTFEFDVGSVGMSFVLGSHLVLVQPAELQWCGWWSAEQLQGCRNQEP